MPRRAFDDNNGIPPWVTASPTPEDRKVMTKYEIIIRGGNVYVVPEYVVADHLTEPMRLLANSVVVVNNEGKTVKNHFGRAAGRDA